MLRSASNHSASLEPGRLRGGSFGSQLLTKPELSLQPKELKLILDLYFML